MDSLVGIVTFQPKVERLINNIEAVFQQNQNIIIYDNGSQNIEEIESLCIHYGILLIKSIDNKGISYALKQIMDYAINRNIEWVLTLDQDSVILPGYLDECKKYAGVEKVGAITPIIKDRNFTERVFFEKDKSYKEVDICITSGCIMNVSAYKETSGYDENMFIDKVDYDICLSLREAGYKIIQINYVGILHEVGHGENVNFFGKKTIIYNHRAWRHFYMTRNALWISRKHKLAKGIINTIINETCRIIVVCYYEKDKINKFLQFAKGLYCGLIK